MIQACCFNSSGLVEEGWLPDMDLNHDKQIQSLLCYRYTIGQTVASMVKFCHLQSRLENP